MTKILITGASGFIGNAFLRHFAGVDGLELYGVGRREVHNFPDTVRYSRLDLARLDDLDFAPDVVIHAAGRTSPWGTPEDYWRDNVLTTEDTIKFCRHRGNPRLIYLSSAAVYYRYQHQLGLTEQSKIGPDFANEYARTKFCGEERVQTYRGEKTILRPCAVFGPGDKLLFPPLLNAARKKMLPLITADATPACSDIMYIDVLCEYLLRAATLPQLRPIYNLSNSEPVEINTFLQQVLKRFDLPAPTIHLSVNHAMLIANVVEGVWRLLKITKEPPITRFGVGVFGYSKTLDIRAALEDFGAPCCSLSAGLNAFIQQYSKAIR